MFTISAFRPRRSLPVTLGVAAVLGTSLVLPGLASAAPVLAYGPYTCAQNFVWREAFDGDTVCVSPGERDTARAENGQASARRSPTGGAYGPDTCLQGFVWREARPTDHVCVDPSRRDRAGAPNSEGASHLVDATQLPAGKVATRSELIAGGGRIYLDGGKGLTPGGRVEFYAAGVNGTAVRPLGTRTADGKGELPRENTALAQVRCELKRDETATIVVLDVRTGVATTAGTSYAYSC